MTNSSMTIAIISLAFAAISLLISIWGRIETFFIGTRQRKIDLSKRVGEALVSAQMLKNTVSDYIDILRNYIEKGNPHSLELEGRLKVLETEYYQIENFVIAFESITNYFESGKTLPISHASIEAKVARFNQRRILAEYDIKYLQRISIE